VGEQFIDLFAAGAYALCARMFAALAAPSLAWLFYFLAAMGMIFALIESAVEQRPDLWLRHLCAVCLASVLTLMPQSIDLTQLTYGAPGKVEQLFGSRVGAAPHLTYWLERLGATAATSLRQLTHRQPVLAVPGVAAQVDDIASDPVTVNDPQVKANLEIWRRRLVPQILRDHPDLAAELDASGLTQTLLDPTPAAPEFVGAAAAQRAQAVRAALAGAGIDLPALISAQAPLLNQITRNAGAQDWSPGGGEGAGAGQAASISFAQRTFVTTARDAALRSVAFDDALKRADTLAAQMRAQWPQADRSQDITGADQLYDSLGRSIFYAAGVTVARDSSTRATIGSLCQRAGDAVCQRAMAPLIDASERLRVPERDRYNTDNLTTWLEQPTTTALLTITSLLLGTLSSLVVSALPFALGVAKAIAIIVSMIGTWLLLWPGRARVALSWMIGPISFVSLWSVFFNLWADIEPSLTQLATVVSDAPYGSWSARRAMSIAISLGYMGLPSLALGVIYGESGRALYHASARLETALLMAWHTRGSIAAFGRRWLVNSPLARRWNQRVYRAIGLGALRSSRSAGATASKRAPGSAARKPRQPKKPAAS
jgi:hypothetical protein